MTALPRTRRDYRTAGRYRPQEKLVVPSTLPPLTERQAAARVRGCVVNYSPKQLAALSQRSLDAAKDWKRARSCPNASSLIMLARAIPNVRAWLEAEIAGGAHIDDPRTINDALTARARELDKRGGT